MGTAHRLAHGFYPSAGAGITLACVQAPVTGTGWTCNGDAPPVSRTLLA